MENACIFCAFYCHFRILGFFRMAEPPITRKQASIALTSAAVAVLIVKASRVEYYSTGHPFACPDDVTAMVDRAAT
jgi:hypothetical protein